MIQRIIQWSTTVIVFVVCIHYLSPIAGHMVK